MYAVDGKPALPWRAVFGQKNAAGGAAVKTCMLTAYNQEAGGSNALTTLTPGDLDRVQTLVAAAPEALRYATSCLSMSFMALPYAPDAASRR